MMMKCLNLNQKETMMTGAVIIQSTLVQMVPPPMTVTPSANVLRLRLLL